MRNSYNHRLTIAHFSKKVYHEFMENKNRASPALRWILGGIMFVSIFFVLCFAAWAILGMVMSPQLSINFGIAGGSEYKSSLVAFRQTEKNDSGEFKGYAYFEFSDEQKVRIAQFAEQNKSAAFSVRVRRFSLPGDVSESAFAFGMLYDSDFAKRGKLRNELESRPLVTADLSKVCGDSDNGICEFSFAFENLPRGFFIYSASPVAVKSVIVNEVVIGWKRSGDGSFYGFSSDGGAATESYDMNFSNAFTHENVTVTVHYLPTSGNIGSANASSNERIEVAIAGKNLQVRRAHASSYIQFPSAAFSSTVSGITITRGQNFVNGITVGVTPGAASGNITASGNSAAHSETISRSGFLPYKVDPGLILNWNRRNWRQRDYELFEWDRFHGVLIFDFADYDVQDNFLRRLAFYVEKAGFRGRLLSDAELAGKHGYNAHDYSTQSLANFFEKARVENFRLNESEYLLRDILLANKVIVQEESGAFRAGHGAIISISQESHEYLRRQLLAHEGWHGIYFVDEDFRMETRRVFDMTDKRSIEFMVGYFTTTPGLNYDISDTNLMANEFMSYLLQQRVSDVANYFVGLANRATVQSRIPNEAAYVRSTQGLGFAEAARHFDEYVFARWSLNAGRVWQLTIN